MLEARKRVQRRLRRTPLVFQGRGEKEGIGMHVASERPHAGVLEHWLNTPSAPEPERMAISWPARPVLMLPVATQGRRTGIGNWPSRAVRAALAAMSPQRTDLGEVVQSKGISISQLSSSFPVL